MSYIIGFLAVCFVIWKIYSIFTSKSDTPTTIITDGPSRGKIRPDKPSDLNQI
jgi:hypothetical protein